MTEDGARIQRIPVLVESRARGGVSVRVGFDPSVVWPGRDEFHVVGTLGGHPFRGEVSSVDGEWRIQLGPAWCHAPGFEPGDRVAVVVGLEVPQSTTMGPDVAAAFAAEPAAARFFDSLPTFYRKNQARRIEGAKRPQTRARAIAETVELAKRGQRER